MGLATNARYDELKYPGGLSPGMPLYAILDEKQPCMETVGKKHHIVIVGAGIGGLATALRLEQFAKAAHCNVTVIDRDRFHCYHALLYQSATAFGITHPQRDVFLRSSSLVPVCGLPHSALLSEIHMIRGEVEGIHPEHHAVTLRDGTRVLFDTLVFALGSVSNDFGIRGIQEYSIPLRTEHDAEAIRAALIKCRERAMKGERVRIVIAGAGVSGVEIAGACGAEIADLVRSGEVVPKNFVIEVIEASPKVLPGFPPAAQDAVVRRLTDLGVTIRCGVKLSEVTASATVYEDGTSESYDTLLWCGGLLGHPLVASLSGSLNKKRQVEVTANFEVPNTPNIFVIGDAASAVDPKTHTPLPQTAAVAVAEGRWVADTILQRLQHSPTSNSFTAPESAIAIPIGHRYGVYIHGTKVIVGYRAWLIRKWLDWKYFRSIAPWQSAWEMFRRGFFPPLG